MHLVNLETHSAVLGSHGLSAMSAFFLGARQLTHFRIANAIRRAFSSSVSPPISSRMT